MADVEAVGEATPAWQTKTDDDASERGAVVSLKLLLIRIATKAMAPPHLSPFSEGYISG